MQVNILKDLSEVANYNLENFPLYARKGLLSSYPNYSALCHWHPDLEFNYVINGEMDFYVAGKTLTIHAGECIFVNSNLLHYGYSLKKKECEMICVLISPALFNVYSYINDKYLVNFVNNDAIDTFIMSKNIPYEANVINSIINIYELLNNYAAGNEIKAITEMWNILYLLSTNLKVDNNKDKVINYERESLTKMIAYIEKTYMHECNIKNIATMGQVCRNKCFEIFKKHFHTTPSTFVMMYRLKKSIDLFNSNMSLTEIAYACGFCSASHYAKCFKDYYKISPKEYRNKLNN